MAVSGSRIWWQRSRDRGFLLRTAGSLTAVSVVLAFALSGLAARQAARSLESGAPPESIEDLVELIRFGGLPGRSCADLLNPLAQNGFLEDIEAAQEDFVRDPALPMVQAWWRGLAEGDLRTALTRLAELPEQRWRDEFRGDLFYLGNRPAEAIDAYLAEAAAHPGADYSSRSALHLARFSEDLPRLRELLDDPIHRAALNGREQLRYEILLARPLPIAAAQARIFAESLLSPATLVALLAAAVWAMILTCFHAGGRRLLGYGLAAFALGIAAGGIAAYAAVIQEELRGFRFRGEDPLGRQILQLLAGPGLRAETAKLLAFLPLALALRRRGNDLLILVLAGLVGVGFAFHDNVIAFAAEQRSWRAGTAFLTDNVLQFSLSGVAGHALWRMLSRSFRGWEDFLLVFLLVVAGHALYLGLAGMPALNEYAVLAPIYVAAVGYRYFDPLRQHLDVHGFHRRIAPLGPFVLGTVLLLCTGLVESAAWTDFGTGLGVFAFATAGMIPIAFAFISRFRDL